MRTPDSSLVRRKSQNRHSERARLARDSESNQNLGLRAFRTLVAEEDAATTTGDCEASFGACREEGGAEAQLWVASLL